MFNKTDHVLPFVPQIAISSFVSAVPGRVKPSVAHNSDHKNNNS